MIVGIGIDAVTIARFAHWHAKSDKQLKKIFSDEEITYCRSVPAKSAERFAVRFAAREALLKALSSIIQNLLFLQVSKACTVTGIPPRIYVDLSMLNIHKDRLTVHLSLSHTQTDAYAVVVVERI